MINNQLINPKSIVVIGASNDLQKTGGKMLSNIINGKYTGELLVVNRKQEIVQNQKTYQNISELPNVELAILAIPARFCPAAIEELINTKNTKAFIVVSAGFGELNDVGHQLETDMINIVNKNNACLAGPNCIGVLNQNYTGVFTTPIPNLDPQGCDFISSSGSVAVFLMEAGMQVGLRFSSVYSVGNGANITIEDYLEYLDNSFDANTSSRIKILYIENISNPEKLRKHAVSLINKGCRIAAIKAGSSSEGSRAASSHTGAIATSDMSTKALFSKSGIINCDSREELITMASVFSYKELAGDNIAVISHAGGSAVMLTDALSHGGLNIPIIDSQSEEELLSNLYEGSSATNPIDFLATGTAEQLSYIIDYCENKLDYIDAMIVIFGSPGLFGVKDVYRTLDNKLKACKKPIFPVLPSVINADEEIKYFISKGNVNFPYEVTLGKALAKIYNTPKPMPIIQESNQLNRNELLDIIKNTKKDSFLDVSANNAILDSLDILRVKEQFATTKDEAIAAANRISYPIVMKVVGPLHKTDVGGVAIDINTDEAVKKHFSKMLNIPNASGVILQQYIKGLELFVGVKYEEGFGHLLFMGLGGIFVEVLKDIQVCLCPCSRDEISYLLKKLKAYPILEGTRGKEGINLEAFIDIIHKISQLTQALPEVRELDINPLIASGDMVIPVDIRVLVG